MFEITIYENLNMHTKIEEKLVFQTIRICNPDLN